MDTRYQSVISILLVAALFWPHIFIATTAFADETLSTDSTSSLQASSGQADAPAAVTTPEAPVAPAEIAANSDTSSTSNTEQSSVSETESAPATAASSDETQQESSTSASESSTSSGSESDTSLAATTTQEEHDNLSIHASTTGELLGDSISAVIETAQDVASSSDSGFISTFGELASTTETDSATTGAGGGGSPLAGSCSARQAVGDATDNADSAFNGATIRSGKAVVLANILNMLNTTFINSPGSILFSNFADTAPTIDLRDAKLLTGMCGDRACGGQDGLQVHLVDDATIDNDILLDAKSGRNAVDVADSTSTEAAIETGDAIAGLNLVNMANTTFINSQYLIVTLNAFRGVDGDIVFPSLLNFFAGGQGGALEDGSTITNDATVTNDVAAGADSGGNTTLGADNSLITTGQSGAYTNVFNQINTMLPNNQITILFRISGAWKGNIYGLPDNVSQIRGPDGSVFIFGSHEGGTSSGSESTLLNSTSTADINNRVNVAALSGQNAIENASTSVISTGSALAAANIVNIANQNIIGRNWILAIIDIFGDFNGDIAFGRPDLWIGDQVEAPGVVQNGSELTYKVTVINNGDAKATGVVVTERPDFSHLDIIDSSAAFATSTPGALTWEIGELAPGKAVEMTYHARVKNSGQGQEITNASSVVPCETDNKMDDNSDHSTVRTTVFGGGGGGGGGGGCCSSAGISSSSTKNEKPRPDALKVERLTNAMAASFEAPRVAQRIVITNGSSTPVHNVVFHDTLRDYRGNLVHEEIWKLDTVAGNEEITILYDVVFDKNATPGIYTLTTELEGSHNPSTLFANGSILLRATPQLLAASIGEIPKVKIANRKVQAAPYLMEEEVSALPLTAAVAASDPAVHGMFFYMMLFALIFVASWGALKAKRRRAPYESHSLEG